MNENVTASLDFAFKTAMSAATELDNVTGRKDAEPALLSGQEAWINYRDTHCDYVGVTYGGGSGTGIAVISCKIELGRSRVAELMMFAE